MKAFTAGVRKMFCNKPKTQRPSTPHNISSPFGATTGDGRPLDAACLAQLGVRQSSSGFFVPAMMESSPLGNRRVCRASVRYSGVTKSKPSMRSRQSVRVSAQRQSRMVEMASRDLGLSSSPPPSRRARCDSFDSADEAGFSYRVTNYSDSDSIISVISHADARVPSIVVDAAAVVANDVRAATNSVAAAADAAWQYDFKLPDVAMRDTLPESYEAYDAFKARWTAYRSAAPPSLDFIPGFPSLSMETSGAHFTPAPLSPARNPEAVAQHRDEALASLEGYGPAPAAIPASLRPQAYPTSLMPGPRYTDAEGNVRASMSSYRARPSTPLVEGPDSYNSVRDKHRSQGKAENHGQSGVYYDFPRGGRAQTPMSFASNEQHTDFYSRVESGVYEVPSSSAPQPTYTAYSPASAGNRSSSGSAIKRKPANITKSRDGKKTTTAVYTSYRKPVPSAPAPAAAASSTPARKSVPSASSTVPPHHKMNDNGYPKTDLRRAEARYSATPTYQTRTVDSVEAKFQKETGKSTATEVKLKKAAEKAQKASEKAAKNEGKKQRQARDAVRIERELAQWLG